MGHNALTDGVIERKLVYPGPPGHCPGPPHTPCRMRPALLWLRTLILLTTVLLTMGKGAWAFDAAPGLSHDTPSGWTCVLEDPLHDQGGEAEPDRHTFSGGDDDRGELLILHKPWLPSSPPDAHPAILADLRPAHPWLSLPLRPPQA